MLLSFVPLELRHAFGEELAAASFTFHSLGLIAFWNAAQLFTTQPRYCGAKCAFIDF